jgi:hypothetical protein
MPLILGNSIDPRPTWPDPIPLSKDQLARLYLSDEKSILAQGHIVQMEAFGDIRQTRFTIQVDGIYPERAPLKSKVIILLVEEE